MERLKKVEGFEIIPFAVLSEPEMIPLCEKYGVNWVMHENLPLGAKKNYGLQQVREVEFDWLMEIGSDTLILDELLGIYKQVTCDFFGVSDCVFIETDSGACRRLTNKYTTYGAGRIIKREVLEKMDFKIWPDQLSRGLDNGSIYNMNKKGISYRQIYPYEEPHVIELKSDVNIWKFNHFKGTEYPLEKVLTKLSEKEQELIYAGIENQYR
jgi:hypothetical protein